MSKEKQIEEMARHCHFREKGKCLLLDDETVKCDMNCDMYEFAEHLYNAGYRKQEWISVEDRLPERNGRYLTHCKIEGQSLVCILYYCKVGGFNEGMVTHWMPLPEPPKMKGGAE